MAERKDPVGACTGFDWDDANAPKTWERHRITPEEAEDIFSNEPLIVRSDLRHGKREKRYYALGQTGGDRYLFAVFTIRGSLRRVISVRDINLGAELRNGFSFRSRSRLPVAMIEDLKILANQRGVPYQSLLKVFLAERLKKELRRAS